MPTAIEEEIKQKPLEEVAGILQYRNRMQIAVARRKNKDLLQSHHDQKIDALKVHELEKAKREIIKVVQGRCFHDKLLSLQGTVAETANPSKVKSVKKSSHRCQLDPVLLEGLICVCLAVDAIYMKVAHTLDTNSFIHALRCYITRRGQPQCIQSDNGSNFVRGEKEL